MKVQGNRAAWDERKGHSGLIHFLLEQIERVLSTGCMEWTNAEGLQSARIEPDSDLPWANGRLAFKPYFLTDLERPFRGSIGRGGEDSCGGI